MPVELALYPNANIGTRSITTIPVGTPAWQALDASGSSQVQFVGGPSVPSPFVQVQLANVAVGAIPSNSAMHGVRVLSVYQTSASSGTMHYTGSVGRLGSYAQSFLVTGAAPSPTTVGGNYIIGYEPDDLDSLEILLEDTATGTMLPTIYSAWLGALFYFNPTVSSVAATNFGAGQSLMVTWSFSGDTLPQSWYQIKVFTETQYTSPGFSPDTFTGVWESGQVADSTNFRLATALADDTYRVYVRAAQSIGAGTKQWSAWVFDDYVVDRTPTIDLPQPPFIGGDQPPTQDMVFHLVDDKLGVLNLSCGEGYVLTEYDLGTPTPRVVTYPRPFHDGDIDLTSVLGARVVNLQITLQTDVAPVARLRERILAYYHPSRRPWLRFTELHDDRWRRIAIRGDNAGINVLGPVHQKMSVSFVGYDGVIISDDLHETTVNPASATPASVGPILGVVHNDGNAPADWTLTIEGRVDHPTIDLNGGADGHMKLDYDFVHDGYLVLDSLTKTILWYKADGSVVSAYQFLDVASSWFTIPPGTNSLSLTDDIAPGSAPLTVGLWAPVGLPGQINAIWQGSPSPPDDRMVWTLEDGFSTKGLIRWRDTWVG